MTNPEVPSEKPADAAAAGGPAPDAPEAQDPRIGQIVSERYRILGRLGEGGMGAVYLAEHTHMRKRVALKLLHAEMGENQEVLARFEREAQAAAHIEHPNVAAATDFGRTADGAFFLVLEYVEGRSLRQALADGPMHAARALHILRQMASALSRAHDAGIVHRDLKPENVMLVHRGDDPDFVKVLDFGIAKMDAPQARTGAPGQPLTRMGTILGTPEYMAPEQALGEPVTPQADLYALGIIFYEMLTGKHPFETGDMMAILSFHIVAPVPRMADRAPAVDVPPAVEDIAHRLLAKDKNARPASARELVGLVESAAVSLGFEVGGVTSSPNASSSPGVPPVASSPRITGENSWSKDDSFAKTSFGDAVTPSSPQLAVPGGAALTAIGTPAARDRAGGSERPASPLAPLAAALLALPRNVKIGLAAAIPVGFLLVIVIALLVRGKPAKHDETKSTDDGKGAGVVALLRGKKAPDDKVRAAGKDVAALEALAKEYPEDAAVARSLASSYDAAGRAPDAIRALETLAKENADGAAEADTVDLVAIIAGREREPAAESANALLETLGERGVDALVELSEKRAGTAKARATKSLAKPDVRARASEATGVLLDLRSAKDCAAKKALLERAGKVGDARVLPMLRQYQKPRGCGFAGIRDCWPCMRKDDALDDAVTAVTARSPATPARGQ